MKTDPDSHDEPLRKVLSEWRTTAALPPHFQENVWQRIERAQTPAAPSVWATVAQWVGELVSNPALAASYVAVLLAIGGTAGWAQARQDTARVKNELGQRYVRVIDPYLAPRK